MAKTTEASGGFVLCVCFVCCYCLFLSDKFFTVQFKWVELYLSVTYSQKYSNWCMSTKRNFQSTYKSTLTGCLDYCGYTRTNSGKIPDCLMLRLFSKFFFFFHYKQHWWVLPLSLIQFSSTAWCVYKCPFYDNKSVTHKTGPAAARFLKSDCSVKDERLQPSIILISFFFHWKEYGLWNQMEMIRNLCHFLDRQSHEFPWE